MISLLRLILPVLLISGASIHAQDQFQYTLPHYSYQQFENGFEVILVENHTNPLIATIVVTRTGLRNETPDNNGVSHMLEHLIFNGTQNRTQEALYDELDYFGIYLNAQTSEDYTTYMSLSHKDQVKSTLDILSDMLFRCTFPPEKFEKEKGIIIEEIRRDGENPDYRKEQALRKAFYQNPPYAMPVIGTIQSVQNMSREQVITYYQKYYKPNNMIALVIGDFKSSQMQQLIKEYFGSVAAGGVPATPVTLQQSFPFFNQEVDDKEHHIYLKLPAPTFHSEHFIPFQFYQSLAFHQKNGRVVQSLRENRELQINKIQATYDFHPEFATLTLMVTASKEADAEFIKKSLIRELEKMQSVQITETELQAIRQSEAISEILETDKILYYGFLKAQELAIGGRTAFETIIPAMLQEKEKNINQFIRTYHRTWTTPEKLFTASRWPEKIRLNKYRQKLTVEDTTESRIYRHIFPNGLTLILMRNTDNPVLSMHFLFKNRAAWEPENQTGIADFLHHALFNASRHYPSDQLQLELQKIGAEIKAFDWDFIPYDDYYNVPEYSYIRILTLDQFFQRALDITVDNIQFPDLGSHFDKVQQQMLGIAGRQQGSASQTARLNFFRMLLGENHPLTRPVSGTPASIQGITAEDLQNFHRSYFSAGNIILSIVSSLDSATVFSAVENSLGKLPATIVEKNIPPPAVKMASHKDSLAAGAQQAYIYLGYTFQPEPQSDISLRVMTDMLSNQITFRLREEKGWAYRVGSSIDHWKNTYYFYTSMGTGRETTYPAINGIVEEMASFKISGLSEKKLERTKNSMLGSLVRRRASRDSQAYTLGINEFYAHPVNYFFTVYDQIKQVNISDIEQVKDRYLQTDHYHLFYTIPAGTDQSMPGGMPR